MVVRQLVTFAMWITYLAAVWFAMVQFEWMAIVFAFIAMIPLIVAMGVMWSLFDNDNDSKFENSVVEALEIEKRKRERIDTVLRDLSDEELQRLRKRLSDGTVDDDDLYDMIVGDDGELVRKE